MMRIMIENKIKIKQRIQDVPVEEGLDISFVSHEKYSKTGILLKKFVNKCL